MDYKSFSKQLKNQMLVMVLHYLLNENAKGKTQAAMMNDFGLDWGEQDKAKVSTQQYYMCAICGYLKDELHILSREQKSNGDGGKWFIPPENIEKAKEYLKKLEHSIQISSSLKLNPGNYKSAVQKIFFGAPGTGKSHRIDAPEAEGGLGLKSIPSTRKFRTTFHPDYDYAQFVGSYKPVKLRDKVGNPILVGGVPQIGYEFVPQVFAKAYIAAWKEYLKAKEKPEPVYLVVEEINRGNCAQIFGDIFQLLDRKAGWSEYSIDVDHDFAEYIRTKMGDDFDAYCAEIRSRMEESIDEDDFDFNKIILPCNLNILATMNTSDQSLFPMDSAFKRRFDWEYVPIDYKKTEADFTIVIGDKKYRWLDFLKKVNADIYIATESEDKQMGEFFVKPSDGKTIDLPTFCSKVLFYLWDSVYKDDDQNKKVFRFDWKFDDEEKNRPVTFQSLFEDEKTKIAIVQKMMENLDVKDEIEDSSDSEQENESNSGITPSARGLKSIKFSNGPILDQGTSFDIYKAALEKIGIDEVAKMAAVSGYHRRGRPFVSKEKYPEIENDSEFSYVQIGEYNVIKGINDRAKLAFLNYLKKNIAEDMTIEE